MRVTPAFCSHRAFTDFRSMCHLLPFQTMNGSAAAPSVARSASGTSLSVSKQHWPIAGPTAARMSAGSQP